ncbi:MAG: phage holin [Clostridia bacterium]|nr:phage holin [Clostridia bacterium]
MINWTVRLRNKTWLASMLALIVTFAYDMLAMLDVVPPVGEEWVLDVINTALMLLGMLGVVTDPTTKGMGDSAQALTYTEPK